MMRKELVGCVNIVVGKNNFHVQFEYGKKKEISYYLLVFLSPKEEIEMDEVISQSTEKE